MGWIDLFGFGTSGWNSGAYAYQPYDASWEDYDYCSANLAGNYENADWGIYNAISNGGDLPGRWRTLTKDEWDYLLYRRTNATNKVGHATVNGMQGIVILPDDWRLPSSCTFTPDNYDYSYYYGEYRGFYYTNTYSVTQWDDMESRGAVFLPAAGQREGSDVRNVGQYGYYWTATGYSSDIAYDLYFNDVRTTGSSYRCIGLSVRLVKDVTGAK